METSGRSVYTPEEMEFFAEDVLIQIVPNFSLPELPNNTLNLITDAYGPFQPNIPIEVPFWMARALYKRKKCTIVPPAWMEPDNLQDVLEQERGTNAVFQPLPAEYIELAQGLCGFGRACFGESFYQVKDRVESIRKVRFTKIEAGLRILEGPMPVVKLNNLSAMELNLIRPLFAAALDRYQRLAQDDVREGNAAMQAPGSVSSGPTPVPRRLRA